MAAEIAAFAHHLEAGAVMALALALCGNLAAYALRKL